MTTTTSNSQRRQEDKENTKKKSTMTTTMTMIMTEEAEEENEYELHLRDALQALTEALVLRRLNKRVFRYPSTTLRSRDATWRAKVCYDTFPYVTSFSFYATSFYIISFAFLSYSFSLTVQIIKIFLTLLVRTFVFC